MEQARLWSRGSASKALRAASALARASTRRDALLPLGKVPLSELQLALQPELQGGGVCAELGAGGAREPGGGSAQPEARAPRYSPLLASVAPVLPSSPPPSPPRPRPCAAPTASAPAPRRPRRAEPGEGCAATAAAASFRGRAGGAAGTAGRGGRAPEPRADAPTRGHAVPGSQAPRVAPRRAPPPRARAPRPHRGDGRRGAAAERGSLQDRDRAADP